MRTLSIAEARILLEAGAVQAVTLRWQEAAFQMTLKVGQEDMLLLAKRGTPRRFKDLNKAVRLLKGLGVSQITLDIGQYPAPDILLSGEDQAGTQSLPVTPLESPHATSSTKNIDPDAEPEPAD